MSVTTVGDPSYRNGTTRPTAGRSRQHDWRFVLMGALLSFVPVLIVLQMVRIQTDPEQAALLRERIPRYQGSIQPIQPPRGLIYDRWGRLLAGNKTVYQVGVELANVENPDTIATTLDVVLDAEYDRIFRLASQEASDEAVYAVLATHVSEEQVEKLKSLMEQMEIAGAGSNDPNKASLRGLVFEPMLARTYPEKETASNILGFVSLDGQGYYGVEERFNQLLAGKRTNIFVPLDPNQAKDLPSVPPGASLVLTIDREIQAEVERILDDAIDFHGAESGTVVVLNPRTGELLAMATTPRMDLNNYIDYLDQYDEDNPFNRVISQAYEPGSVYKILTVAAGLDSGAIRPETTFLDTGVFEIGGIYIYNWNGGAWGQQDMTGCLQHSLNVCMAWIASQTGAATFYNYMEAFGIGNLTGVDMAGEVPGRLKRPGDGDWYDADLGTNSFGQGVATTPLQMAVAASALANEGQLMAPHVVRSLIDKGYQYDIEPRVLSTPVRPETARTLTEMLANSLEIESSDALVTGYRVAGKTGTAEIPTPFGYTSNQTNASFVGWGPVDDPQFLVYVWLEKPSSSIWGSEVAAPVFSEIVQHLVVLLDLPPDDIRQQLTQSQ